MLAALFFVLGQTLAYAHAAQHELTASNGKVSTCELCAQAHAGGAAVAASPSPPVFSTASETPVTAVALCAPQQRPERPHSRGPPISLV